MNLRPANNLNPAPYPNGNNEGYLALGGPTFNSPLWHVSLETPFYNGFGELLLGTTVSDVPRSYAGILNPAISNGIFVPTFYGHLDSSQTGPAVSTAGNIDPINDVAPGTNNDPVHRFIVQKGNRLHNLAGSATASITNRMAFAWHNNSIIKMMMNAEGQMRIGQSLNIPNTLPHNRVEITGSANAAVPNDPYWSTPNGCSGLRLTNLTSSNTPLANGTNSVDITKVLSVDGNGDVVLVNPAAAVNANNGLSVINGTLAQLGASCGSGTVGLGQLLNDREIQLNNHNLIISESSTKRTGKVGIGVGIASAGCTPGNMLEVSNGTAPNNISGLRLTDLAGGSPGGVASNVLSVNGAGDVILSPLPPVIGPPGNYCSGTFNPLSGGYQMDLNGWQYNFTAPVASAPSQVLIGQPICNSWQSRLSVWDDALGEGIYGYSSRTSVPGNNVGVHGNATDNAIGALNSNIGVLGEVNNIVNMNNSYVGIAGFVNTPVLSSIPLGSPIGVYGNSQGFPTGWAGYFDGDVWMNGNCWALNYFVISDKRFKKDIKKIENVNDKLQRLNGYTYNFRTEEFKERNFEKTEQVGLIAQELKEVFPQLVHEDRKGYLSVNYQGMVPVLIEALKEQQNSIADLKNTMTNLEQIAGSLSSGSVSADSKIDNSQTISITDKNVIVLNQNVPNPFAESTTITYNIPNNFTKAQIIFNTTDGKVIKTADITAKGPGRLNVFANDLSSGMYSYSLIVDGKIIDTKKMVKE